MSSSRIRMLNLDREDDRAELIQEAGQYFMNSLERVSEEQRVADYIDVHLWVSGFIHKMVRLGRIHDDDLAANIVQLTYVFWKEALQIVEEHEQALDDEEAHNA